jgi:hypothetical protein
MDDALRLAREEEITPRKFRAEEDDAFPPPPEMPKPPVAAAAVDDADIPESALAALVLLLVSDDDDDDDALNMVFVLLSVVRNIKFRRSTHTRTLFLCVCEQK